MSNLYLNLRDRVLKELKSKNLINLINEKKPNFNGNLIIGQSPRKYQLTSKGIDLAQELLS